MNEEAPYNIHGRLDKVRNKDLQSKYKVKEKKRKENKTNVDNLWTMAQLSVRSSYPILSLAKALPLTIAFGIWLLPTIW